MPAEMERIRKAVQRTGKSKSSAYAIAWYTFKRMHQGADFARYKRSKGKT